MKIVPAKYRDADVESLDPTLKEFLIAIADAKKSFLLFGGVGAGKTYAAYAIAKHIGLENVMVVNVPHLLATMRGQINRSDQNENTLLDIAEYSRYLILDDIGVEKSSDWVFENLYTIVNYRYENMLPTIITSNLDVGQIAQKLGERIASRIYEMCELIQVTGGDKRII